MTTELEPAGTPASNFSAGLRLMFGAITDAARQMFGNVKRALRAMDTDAMREALAIDAGRRYWTDKAGRVRRTPGHRPLLHKGRKP